MHYLYDLPTSRCVCFLMHAVCCLQDENHLLDVGVVRQQAACHATDEQLICFLLEFCV